MKPTTLLANLTALLALFTKSATLVVDPQAKSTASLSPSTLMKSIALLITVNPSKIGCLLVIVDPLKLTILLVVINPRELAALLTVDDGDGWAKFFKFILWRERRGIKEEKLKVV